MSFIFFCPNDSHVWRYKSDIADVEENMRS